MAWNNVPVEHVGWKAVEFHLSFSALLVVVVRVVGGRPSGRGCDSSYPQIEYTEGKVVF